MTQAASAPDEGSVGIEGPAGTTPGDHNAPEANDATPAPALGLPVSRVAVPASLFRGDRSPPFVIFDAHGGLGEPVAARAVHISPADSAGLREFLLERLASIARDGEVPVDDLAWVVTHLLVHEIADLIAAQGQPLRRSPLRAVLRQLARLAGRGAMAAARCCHRCPRSTCR